MASSVFFRYLRLPEPYLRFHMRRKFISPRRGLTIAGPYDADHYRNDSIYIGLITEPSTKSQAKAFIKYLMNGYKYYKGFKIIFKVGDFIFDDENYVRELRGLSDQDEILHNIENAYLELAEILPKRGIIIIALRDEVIDKHYSWIKTLRFKYTKSIVRLQLIKRSTLEKALNDPIFLDFALLNVASALYAKIGGTPWVLDQQLIPAGIFIGIAFTRPKVIRKTDQTKELFYYGVLTIYNKFGRYIDTSIRSIQIEVNRSKKIRGTKGLYIPRQDMVEVLEQTVRKYKTPIIIIHKSARFHRDEVSATREVLENREISYALIHVESSNPYRGYGEDKHDETAVRGDLILDKELNNRAILFTTGCIQSNYGIQKRRKVGTPRPLEIEIGNNTTPYDAKDFAEQILGLTKLDWNTTDPEVRVPITIKYARKATGLTRYLSFYHQPSPLIDIRDLM